MEQFNLKTWLKDKSRKVVTRNGRPVTIVCHKSPYDTIVGFCGKDQYPDLWDLNGKFLKNRDSDFDLFFADEEDGLTNFEKAVQNILNEPHFQDVQAIKQFSKTLLDLARKEILKDLPKWKKCDDNLPYSHIGGLNNRYLIKNGYCINISDLEKLPKEE